MNDDAKRLNIRWRRIFFGAHLLIWLIARLAVGSIQQTPPEAIYDLLQTWGFFVAFHALLLVILDGRDRADLPIQRLHKLIEPRERRWSLLAIDAMLWIMLTVAIANRLIPYNTIVEYAAPISLTWLALTAVGMTHSGLVLYAEIRDRAPMGKRKNQSVETALLTRDGELLETIEESSESNVTQRIKRS